MLEIICAGSNRVPDFALADVNAAFVRFCRIGLHVINFVRVQPIFQSGKSDDGFENGAGRVISVSRTVDLRLQFRIAQICGVVRHINRIDRRRRNHRQHVAAVNIHDDDCCARVRTFLIVQDCLFGNALDVQINCQHYVMAGFGLAPDVFGLAETLAVDKQRFLARLTAQL